MTQILAALLSVGLPALAAYGSSSRRRLAVIREEIKTLGDLDPESEAATTMRLQVNESVDRYRNASWDRGRVAFRYGGLSLVALSYVSLTIFFMLALDLEIVTDAFPSQRAQAVAQVVALLVGLVSAATAVVLVNGYGHLSKQYVRRLNVEMHRLRSEDD